MLSVADKPIRYQVLAAETGRWSPRHDLIVNYMGFIARYPTPSAQPSIFVLAPDTANWTLSGFVIRPESTP
jgi:hypothetical protein